MNYFEIINRCLLELNYKAVDIFENLTKSEHIRLKSIINRVNIDIVSSHDWWFRQRKAEIELKANTIEQKPDISGMITSLYIDGKKYIYNEDYESFYRKNPSGSMYSLFNNYLLLPEFKENKTATVFYSTDMAAISENGIDKKLMEFETDRSIIPEKFVEPLLVYGACMKFKATADNPKFKYWNAEYILAFRNLKSHSMRAIAEAPEIIIKR